MGDRRGLGVDEEGGQPLVECRVVRAIGEEVDVVRQLEGDAVVAGALQLLSAQAEPLNEAQAMPGGLGRTPGETDGAGTAKRPEQHAQADAHLLQADSGLGMARI